MKRIVKLTESDLKNLISSILEETSDFDNGGMDDSEMSMDSGKILKEIDNNLNTMRQEIANELSAMVSK